MRNAIRKAKEGFTLIELMIVVAIVGILAVLAIYGVRKYIANSKTAEARNSLGQIGKDAQTAYEKETMSPTVLGMGGSTAVLRQLCQSATASVPAASTSIKGSKYQSNPTTDWNKDIATNSGFYCLKFTLEQPQYYMYDYVAVNPAAAGGSFTATANGDLNGDGSLSTFTLTGSINASLALNLAPNLQEVNPEE